MEREKRALVKFLGFSRVVKFDSIMLLTNQIDLLYTNEPLLIVIYEIIFIQNLNRTTYHYSYIYHWLVGGGLSWTREILWVLVDLVLKVYHNSNESNYIFN